MNSDKSHKFYEILGRKKIIAGLIILIILLILATIMLVLQAIEENKQKNVIYTENSNVGYKVYLKENDFFEQKYLKEDRQSIPSIIDYIAANFKYELESSEPNTNYKYTYKIVAETNVEELENRNSIYKFSEDLVKEKYVEVRNNSKLQIVEDIKINYNKYNKKIKEFIDVYGLDDINPTVTIKMFVNVHGITKETTTPVSSLVIPLTTKTVAIDIESNTVNETDVTVYKKITNKEKLYLAVLTFVLTLMVIIELMVFINNTKDEDAVYKMKIKKILANYDSYIQKINGKFSYEGYQKIETKSFDDLLQIRDTISQPILMIEKSLGKEMHFVIPTEGKEVYIYKLKNGKKNNNKNNIENKA